MSDRDDASEEAAIPESEKRLRGPGPTGRRAQKGQRGQDDTGARIYPGTPPGELFPSDPPES